jgi:uncharacterized membrane protein (GlpM family)
MLFEKIQLEADEKIIKIVHKHWFVLVSQAVSIAIVAIAPIVGWVAVELLTQKHTSTLNINLSEYTPYFIYFYSFWLLINWMTLAHMWVTHHLDIWVVTNRRIVVIDQVSLFRRKIGSFRLEKLQDVNIEINGIIATFLHYGTVEAETASNNSDAEFRTKHIPNPRDLKATILKAADDLMEEHTAVQTQRQELQ